MTTFLLFKTPNLQPAVVALDQIAMFSFGQVDSSIGFIHLVGGGAFEVLNADDFYARLIAAVREQDGVVELGGEEA